MRTSTPACTASGSSSAATTSSGTASRSSRTRWTSRPPTGRTRRPAGAPPPASAADELLQQTSQLDGLVALDRVAGTLDDDDLGVGLAAPKLLHVLVADHTRIGPAVEDERHLDGVDLLPQVPER